MRKLSIKTAAVVAVTAAITGFTPAAVSATTASAAADELCPSPNTLCLFEGENYTGERFPVTPLGSGAVCVDLASHGWAGRAKSAINTSKRTAAMFQYSTDCVGRGAPIPTGRTPDFSGWFSPTSVLIS